MQLCAHSGARDCAAIRYTVTTVHPTATTDHDDFNSLPDTMFHSTPSDCLPHCRRHAAVCAPLRFRPRVRRDRAARAPRPRAGILIAPRTTLAGIEQFELILVDSRPVPEPMESGAPRDALWKLPLLPWKDLNWCEAMIPPPCASQYGDNHRVAKPDAGLYV